MVRRATCNLVRCPLSASSARCSPAATSFSEKASTELEADGLTALDVAEAILNAVAMYKTIRSRSPRRQRGEKSYVVVGTTLTGLPLYTKGKFLVDAERATYYFLLSSKRAEP